MSMDDNNTMSMLEALLTDATLAQAADEARAGRHQEAEGLLSSMLAGTEPPLAALDLLARIRAQQRRWAEAEDLWRRVLQRDPSHRPARDALARLQRGHRPAWPGLFNVAAALVGLTLVAAATLLWGRIGSLQGEVRAAAAGLATVQAAIQRAEPGVQPSPTLPALAQAVTERLSLDATLGALEIGVLQEGLGVRLEGAVPSREIKERVEAVARGVEGVTLVDGSALRIVYPPLGEAVANALHADPATAGLPIAVEQVEDGVRLSGKVPNPAALQDAVRVVQSVGGVAWVDTAAIAVAEPAFVYTVRPGDSLAGIAGLFYGDANRWPELVAANAEVLGDAQVIHPGMQLRVPVGATP